MFHATSKNILTGLIYGKFKNRPGNDYLQKIGADRKINSTPVWIKKHKYKNELGGFKNISSTVLVSAELHLMGPWDGQEYSFSNPKEL